MESLFNPKSVAIVGASSNPAKLGYQVVKNIIDYGFKGEIYPVNVKRENVLDRRTYASLLEIGAEVDCVVIVVPAPVVKSVIQDCVQIKAKNAVIITAGFRETGKEGLELEEEIGKIASKGNLRILGPNCLGFISASSHFNCTFASEASIPENGNIYLISQSGAIGTAILDWAKKNKVGISRFVSIGNKLDISEVELLSNVKKGEVVGLYLESLTQGKELLSIGKKISKTNPVIVLKPGKTAAGSSAITSHTGAMATDSVVVSTLFNQAGFLEVDGIEGMFDLLKAFSWQPMLKDNRIGIVTNAGGPAVITTDLLVQAGLNIAQLTDRTHQILLDRLPREANIHNPIDVIGDALADRYAAAIDAVLADENTDALLVLLTPQVTTQIERTANFIYRLSKTHGKPVLASFIGGSLVDQGVEILNRHKIPNFNFPERAIYVLSKMYTYTKQIELINQSELEKSTIEISENTVEKVKKIIIQMEENNQKVLDPYVCENIIKEYGIQIPQTIQPSNITECLSHANVMGYPVTLKISSSHLLHKSDVGGVRLNIANDKDLEQAYNDLEKIISSNSDWSVDPTLNNNIILQKYISNGENVIVGAVNHPGFGHLILFGMGGIYTEIFHDISTRLSPINKFEAESMIKDTKIYQILSGARGQKERDIDGIIDILVKVSSLVTHFPSISQLDINPVIALNKGEGAFAVDTKIILE